MHLLPRLSVLENAMLPARFLRGSDEGLAGRARELLERMGLHRHLEHRPSSCPAARCSALRLPGHC
ncbi:hypothetical protein [Frateuria soli]|uniref:hypothetical protein n=1 Tax=Frateuria soli TaxID=1542730 RepID=UPI001E612924|nr:hypothetical protein [Frateuria soli]UGB37853.1 hypothetical protein LQ771_13695 [Frateuria soli]